MAKRPINMDNYVFDEDAPSELPEVTDEEEVSGDEGAFMKGYNDEEEAEECAECGTAIKVERKVVRAIDEEEYSFCSKDCADEFEESIGK